MIRSVASVHSELSSLFVTRRNRIVRGRESLPFIVLFLPTHQTTNLLSVSKGKSSKLGCFNVKAFDPRITLTMGISS